MSTAIAYAGGEAIDNKRRLGVTKKQEVAAYDRR